MVRPATTVLPSSGGPLLSYQTRLWLPEPFRAQDYLDDDVLEVCCVCGWTAKFYSHGATTDAIWEELWWHGFDAAFDRLPCARYFTGPTWSARNGGGPSTHKDTP